ncbi:hypothetical protein RUND412_011114 [Rhizina undulata]
MFQFPRTQSSFPAATKPCPNPAPEEKECMKPGDGFTPEELERPFIDKKSLGAWFPPKGIVYTKQPISALKMGRTNIYFTGRIANYNEQDTKSGSTTGAKKLLKLTVKDSMGAVEVKLWLSRPDTPTVNLGQLVTVYTPFIAGLDPASFQSSSATVPLFVSLSDNDPLCHVDLHEETEETMQIARVPIGYNCETGLLEGLVLLKGLTEGGMEIKGKRVLIGPKRAVTLKDGVTKDKVEVGVFDDSSESTLVLWGKLTTTATLWRASGTILLITSPRLTFWGNAPQLTISKTTHVDVNPLIQDAKWLQNYAQKFLKTQTIFLPFPGNEIFDWEKELDAENRMLYTFADLDRFTRELPNKQCVGYLSLVIVELNLVKMFRQNSVICGMCCDLPVYSNTLQPICKNCDKPLATASLNTRIIGLLCDETASISGSRLLVSEQAWTSLFGKSKEELVENTPMEELVKLECRRLFLRVTAMFGWNHEIGRVAIWDFM